MPPQSDQLPKHRNSRSNLLLKSFVSEKCLAFASVEAN